MALLNPAIFGRGGGILGPEMGGGDGYTQSLPPEYEALLAQNARDVAAQRMNGRRSKIDMSLFQDQPGALGDGAALYQQMQPQFGAPVFPGNVQQAAPNPQIGLIPPTMQTGLNPPTPQNAQLPVWLTQMQQAGQSMAPQDAIPPAARPAVGGAPQIAQSSNPATVTATPTPPTPTGGNLGAAFSSLFNSPSLISGIGNAITAGMTGQRTDPEGVKQQNQQITTRAIYDGLIAKGHSPQQAMGIASAAAINPAVAQAILPEALGTRKPSGTMKIGNLEVPYIIGENGQAQLVLPGQGGQSGAPLSSLNDLIKFQQQTEAAGKGANAAAEASGKATGEAAQQLPNTLAKADEALKLIDQIRNHPGKAYGTGALGVLPGIPGTKQKDFVTLVDQAKGQAFLQAFQSLKGGGQITEVEGKKATDAIARLDRSQSKEGFDAALNDLEQVIRAGRARAGTVAGGQPTPAAPGWQTVAPGVRIRERQQ